MRYDQHALSGVKRCDLVGKMGGAFSNLENAFAAERIGDAWGDRWIGSIWQAVNFVSYQAAFPIAMAHFAQSTVGDGGEANSVGDDFGGGVGAR